MTPVIVGTLVCVAAAVVILAVVAVPKFREGAPLLTDEGEDAVREARRRAASLAVEAKRRAQAAAQQAGAHAVAAREKAAATRRDHEPAPDREPEPDREPDDGPASAAPVAPPDDEVIDVRDDVPAPGAERAAERGATGATDPGRRRGSHRRLLELGWSDPVPGPRHGRRP